MMFIPFAPQSSKQRRKNPFLVRERGRGEAKMRAGRPPNTETLKNLSLVRERGRGEVVRRMLTES
ncbi:hypothetical protein BH20CHL4_BH20CHL4_05790 [soil metagenome]